jgi:hypothetical protein
MSDVEKLILCRAMVEQPDTAEGWSDDTLKSYLTIAGRKIIDRAFPFDDSVTEVPIRYGVLQCEIATYLLNKRGAEGETSHSENGVSRSYESADIPESLMSAIAPKCQVI